MERRTETKREATIQALCKVINDAQLKHKEIVDIIAGFLYHLGQSLDKSKFGSSEELLKAFASNPTIGNALMAQGLWMKDHWKKERK